MKSIIQLEVEVSVGTAFFQSAIVTEKNIIYNYKIDSDDDDWAIDSIGKLDSSDKTCWKAIVYTLGSYLYEEHSTESNDDWIFRLDPQVIYDIMLESLPAVRQTNGEGFDAEIYKGLIVANGGN